MIGFCDYLYKYYDCYQLFYSILSSALLTHNEDCVIVEGILTAAEQRQISRKKYADSPTRDKEQGHSAEPLLPEDHKYYEIK